MLLFTATAAFNLLAKGNVNDDFCFNKDLGYPRVITRGAGKQSMIALTIRSLNLWLVPRSGRSSYKML